MPIPRSGGDSACAGSEALSNEELASRARAGDGAARGLLVERNLGLVRSIIARFTGRTEEPEDLFQVGAIGLIKAAERFDSNYGTKFTTYAVPLIIGEIKRHLRDTGPIKVSRRLKEVAGLAQRAESRLAISLGRNPTMNELAAELALPAEEVVAALDSARPPTSLFEPVFEDDGEPITLLDQIGRRDGDDKLFAGVSVRQALSGLPERDRRVLFLRFFREKTQAEVAQMLGVSQVQISRLEKHALDRIRRLLGEG